MEACEDYDEEDEEMIDSSTAAWSATQFQVKKEDGALRSPNLLSQSWFGIRKAKVRRKTQDTLCRRNYKRMRCCQAPELK